MRQTQAKSKKDSKLELFGFEDFDSHQEGSSGDNAHGQSSYKIRYFGFEEMSDSDGAEGDDGSVKERRRAKKDAVAKVTPNITIGSIKTDEPPDPFERLESREKPAVKENKKNSERQDSRIQTGFDFYINFGQSGEFYCQIIRVISCALYFSEATTAKPVTKSSYWSGTC